MLHLLIAKYSTNSVLNFEREIVASLNQYELDRLQQYNIEKRTQKIIGFYLLTNQLDFFDQPFKLNDLQRTSYHKPFFKDSSFDFSISYSKNYVVCLASKQAIVGVDIEFNDTGLINYDSPFLSISEQEKLKEKDNEAYFYHLHTRKEAFSKALGLGVFLDQQNFDLQNESIDYNQQTWHITTLTNLENHTLSYVSNNKSLIVKISEIVL